MLRTPNSSKRPHKFVGRYQQQDWVQRHRTHSQEYRSVEVVHMFDLLSNERGVQTIYNKNRRGTDKEFLQRNLYTNQARYLGMKYCFGH